MWKEEKFEIMAVRNNVSISSVVISYDLYPEKPVEAEIKRNLFNWTSIIPPYIMCNGDLTIGVPMLLRYLADSSREF